MAVAGSKAKGVSNAIDRRALFLHVAAACAPFCMQPTNPAQAIVNGESVTDAEAAAAGAVGLWIDLSGCSVCRKGLPATCSGTLISPTLVLSARHCLDTPRALNGTLDRVVFGSDMFAANMARKVAAVATTADYGIETAGNDLILIKLESPAPAPWRPVELPLGLLPSKAEEIEAKRANSPFYPDGLGFPELTAYGYGQQSTKGTLNADDFSAGVLKRINVQTRTEIRPWAPGFLTTPELEGTGTCAGDSGGSALALLQDPQGRGLRQILVGVQAAASLPCENNQQVFVNPAAFEDFILRASKDLGAPVQRTISWRQYS